MVQSDASIWCMGEAGRLADNNETIKIMATATKNLLFFVNRETFLNNFNQRLQDIAFIIKDIFLKICIFYLEFFHPTSGSSFLLRNFGGRCGQTLLISCPSPTFPGGIGGTLCSRALKSHELIACQNWVQRHAG